MRTVISMNRGCRKEFAGSDEAEQFFRQQRRLANADYLRSEIKADTLGAVRMQGNGHGRHSSSSAPLIRYLMS